MGKIQTDYTLFIENWDLWNILEGELKIFL